MFVRFLYKFISYGEFITLLMKMLRSSRNIFFGTYLVDIYQFEICIQKRSLIWFRIDYSS